MPSRLLVFNLFAAKGDSVLLLMVTMFLACPMFTGSALFEGTVNGVH